MAEKNARSVKVAFYRNLVVKRQIHFIPTQNLSHLDNDALILNLKFLFSPLAASFVVFNRLILSFSQTNAIREKEDVEKAKEQSEARLLLEMKSVNENLQNARQEIDKREDKIKDFGVKIAQAEKEKDDLKGDIAGILYVFN